MKERSTTLMPAAATFFALIAAPVARAADHREAPALAIPPLFNLSVDINDVYVFQSPSNPANTVFIMTTNPFAGVPGGSPTTFDSRVRYDFNVDTDFDAVANIVFQVSFGDPDLTGIQDVKLRTVIDGDRAPGLKANGRTWENVPVRALPIPGPNPPSKLRRQPLQRPKRVGTLRAALQDDPFFFDAVAFDDLVGDGVPGNARQGEQFNRSPGHNLFGPIDVDGVPGPDTPDQGPNVLAITIEIPSSFLGHVGATIGFWGATRFEGVQVDRMGFPAINSALIPPVPRTDPAGNFPDLLTGPDNDFRDLYNMTEPKDDALFRQDVIDIISRFYRVVAGPGRTDAVPPADLAGVLLPDTLPFQLDNPAGFSALNGRRLQDDVIDLEYDLLTGGAVDSDNVSNDSSFLNVFPYIGPPNPIPQGPNPN